MVSSTNPQRRNNNPDNAIGQEIRIDDSSPDGGACVMYGGGGNSAAQGLVPNNGEYELGSISGDCNYCIGCQPRRMDTGVGCEGFAYRCAGVGGGFPSYKRTRYNAPIDTCCTNNGEKTVGNQTCDPKYKMAENSPDCDPTYTSRCNPGGDLPDGSGSNKGMLFNDSKCKAWCNNHTGICDPWYKANCSAYMIEQGNTDCLNWCKRNPNLCNTKISQYCVGKNLDSQFCKDKMIELGGNDTYVEHWCSNYPDDPFCSCQKALYSADIQVDPNVKAAFARPECYVKECSSGVAYKNTNMRQSKGCPPMNVCINKMNILGNDNMSLDNIVQKCEQAITVVNPVVNDPPITMGTTAGAAAANPAPTTPGIATTTKTTTETTTRSVPDASGKMPTGNTSGDVASGSIDSGLPDGAAKQFNTSINDIKAKFTNADSKTKLIFLFFIFIIIMAIGIGVMSGGSSEEIPVQKIDINQPSAPPVEKESSWW